jgi:Bifunctional DNA primase/polymerase, N-terminal
VNPAAEAAGRGFAVFPCRPGDKRPAVKDWENRATTDLSRIRECWATGRYNVGIACGPSRLVVLDLDAHGDLPGEWQLPGVTDGKDVMAQVCEWAGMDWPSTYTVATPGNGWHLYFRAPEGSRIRNSASLIGPQVDVRAAGGYVVGAGSVIGGNAYEVIYDEPVEPLPRWITMLVTPPERVENIRSPEFFATVGTPRSIAGLVRTVTQARTGNRNNALFWAACHMAKESPGDLGQLTAAAEQAGLTGRETRATIASAQRRVAR